MRLVLPVKDHELYRKKPSKGLPKEHGNFRHYVVLFSNFWNIASNEPNFFGVLPDILTVRSSHQMCSVKKVFLEISKNSQETSVPGSLF